MANTTSGCSSLVEYLEKEESNVREFTEYLEKENRMGEKECFFNQESDTIEKEDVIHGIDSNCHKLSRNEHRFFSITVNPSQKELEHLITLAGEQAGAIRTAQIEAALPVRSESEIREELVCSMMKEYTVSLMDEYARNFNREGVESAGDLVWFGKVEKERYWKPTSKEVQHNKRIEREMAKAEKLGDMGRMQELEKELIREGDVRKGGSQEVIREWMPKSGDNYHVHVIVSRRDKKSRYRLSPLSKPRKNAEHSVSGRKCMIGFDRNVFYNAAEARFDGLSGYERSFAERFESRKMAMENPELYKEMLKEDFKRRRASEREFQFGRGARTSYEQTTRLSAGVSYHAQRSGRVFAHRVGGDYLEKSARPYIEVGGTVLRTARILGGADKSTREKSRELALSMLSRYSQLAGLGNLSAAIAPYTLAVSVLQRGVSAVNSQRDGMSMD